MTLVELVNLIVQKYGRAVVFRKLEGCASETEVHFEFAHNTYRVDTSDAALIVHRLAVPDKPESLIADTYAQCVQDTLLGYVRDDAGNRVPPEIKSNADAFPVVEQATGSTQEETTMGDLTSSLVAAGENYALEAVRKKLADALENMLSNDSPRLTHDASEKEMFIDGFRHAIKMISRIGDNAASVSANQAAEPRAEETKHSWTLRELVDGLNSMVFDDIEAVGSLLCNYVEVNDELRDHPTCQTLEQTTERGTHSCVGLLGIINGMLGIDVHHRGPIASTWNGRHFLGFVETPDWKYYRGPMRSVDET